MKTEYDADIDVDVPLNQIVTPAGRAGPAGVLQMLDEVAGDPNGATGQCLK